jgi:opacity protein-like surface antigen
MPYAESLDRLFIGRQSAAAGRSSEQTRVKYAARGFSLAALAAVTLRDNIDFTANAGLGAKYYVTNNFFADLEARYRYLDRLVNTSDQFEHSGDHLGFRVAVLIEHSCLSLKGATAESEVS